MISARGGNHTRMSESSHLLTARAENAFESCFPNFVSSFFLTYFRFLNPFFSSSFSFYYFFLLSLFLGIRKPIPLFLFFFCFYCQIYSHQTIIAIGIPIVGSYYCSY